MRALSCLGTVRYDIEIALGILMKGVGQEVLWPQLCALAATAATLGAWSVARRKRHLYA
jgi:ABC-2 type transport system permease protein